MHLRWGLLPTLRNRAFWVATAFLGICTLTMPARGADLASDLAAIQRVGPAGENHAEAIKATASLSKLPASALPAILQAMDGANPLAKNWLFGVAGQLADRGPLPVAELEAFLGDRTRDGDARTWAFQQLTRDDSEQRKERLRDMLDDPAPELKYMAVDLYVNQLEELAGDEQKLQLLDKLLEAAREPAQIQSIAAKSKELGKAVDLQSHFGFLPNWNIVGTFDNANQSGFEVVYGPEQVVAAGQPIDLKAKYAGKNGEVAWQTTTTSAEDGAVDLNPVFNNEKGAICYAFTTFRASSEQPCEVRLGCINANQVWLNGEKIISNDVYHTGTAIDQYVGKGMLKAGENRLLVKVCQNEQKESWAQDWAFQLRITDLTGKAIRPAE